MLTVAILSPRRRPRTSSTSPLIRSKRKSLRSVKHLPRQAIEINRVAGRSYSRVINITLDHTQSPGPHAWLVHVLKGWRFKSRPLKEEFVLRNPRNKDSWVDHEVAMADFLNKCTVTSAPSIIYCDLSENKKIGERYTFQPRLPGQSPLETVENTTFSNLSTPNSASLWLAKLVALSLTWQNTRYLAWVPWIQILQLQCPNRNAFKPASKDEMIQSGPQTAIEFFDSQFKLQRRFHVVRSRFINAWKKLWPIVVELNENGFFKVDLYYLTNMDFEPRSMPIQVVNECTVNCLELSIRMKNVSPLPF
jgi:hypothetical protein